MQKFKEMAVDSAQYRVTPRSMILWGVNLEKLEHLGEISTKIKTILTHYSVAQAGSNYEKKVENLVGLSL